MFPWPIKIIWWVSMLLHINQTLLWASLYLILIWYKLWSLIKEITGVSWYRKKGCIILRISWIYTVMIAMHVIIVIQNVIQTTGSPLTPKHWNNKPRPISYWPITSGKSVITIWHCTCSFVLDDNVDAMNKYWKIWGWTKNTQLEQDVNQQLMDF